MEFLPNFNVSLVKLDAIVAMKLIKQSNDTPQMQIGYLMGLINEETVQITNCYPIPNIVDQDDKNIVEQQQQNDKLMMQNSRKHNLDNNKSGIYIIGEKNEWNQIENFDIQYRTQNIASYAVLLTFSNLLSQQGHPMPFQAFVNDEIDRFELNKLNSNFDKIYKQVPVELVKNPLTSLFLYQFRNDIKSKYSQQNNLKANLSINSSLLQDALDDEINLANRLSKEALDKNQAKQDTENKVIGVNDIIEYFLVIHRVNNISQQIKKESTNILLSNQTVQNLCK